MIDSREIKIALTAINIVSRSGQCHQNLSKPSATFFNITLYLVVSSPFNNITSSDTPNQAFEISRPTHALNE
jgi:hypothetical protein